MSAGQWSLLTCLAGTSSPQALHPPAHPKVTHGLLLFCLPRPPLSFMFRGKRPLRINSPGRDKEFSDLKDHPLCCIQQHSAWAAALLSCVPSSSSLPGPAHIHCSFPGLAVSSAGVSLLIVLYYLGLLFEWNRCQILITCDARIHREGQWLI